MFRLIVLSAILLSALESSYAVVPDGVAPPSNPTVGSPNTGNREAVAFSAIHASQSTRKASNKIVFAKTITDVGYGWRGDQSEFVCFYPGTYFFSFSALSSSTSQIKIGLMRNNDEVISAVGDRVGATTASSSVILNLNKNDRVYLSILEGSIHESKQDSRSYTSFSGFRVY